MIQVKSYLCGEWHYGAGREQSLYNPLNGDVIATACTDGIDLAAAKVYAQKEGSSSLSQMNFAQRGHLLKQMSLALHEARDRLIEVSNMNVGTSRGDAKFDIDGGIGTLAYYASLGKKLGDTKFILDGGPDALTRATRFMGYHVKTSRRGIALHINAFNFPIWGMMEKAACAILAGMPVVTKPATSTALLAYEAIKVLDEQQIMPAGVLQFVGGSLQDFFNYLDGQDSVAFTGSAVTGSMLRRHEVVVNNNIPFNVEADSLNTAALSGDLDSDDDAYQLFLRNLQTEITQKAGQKCTAIRRIFVPKNKIDQVQEDLVERFSDIKVGNPELREVQVGPLATAQQKSDALTGISQLVKDGATLFFGTPDQPTLVDMPNENGYFVGPALLRVDNPHSHPSVHDLEVFAPVSTLMPYEDEDDLIELIAKGQGSLVASIYGNDKKWVEKLILGIAPYHGRIYWGNAKVADQATTPGMVLPVSIHGGPGRAGGGEELGGLRGLDFYMQRTAIQGDRGALNRMLGATE